MHQQIERMNRCQQCQQAGAEQLRRRKMTAPSGTGFVREKQVDQIVRDEWQQLFEQRRKAGLWKLIHIAISYPQKTLPVVHKENFTFFWCIVLKQRNLLRIS